MNKGETLAVPYADLTSDIVESLTPQDAERIAIGLLAENARVKEGGLILSWSEFNENPDPLVNKLLARMIVGQFDRQKLVGLAAWQFAVLSIESSASYLAMQLTEEMERSFHLSRPPRIIRARKLPRGESPSPAMSERKLAVTVHPITAGGEPRTLVASLPDDDQGLHRIRAIVVVDDFKATKSTLNGGIALGINLFSRFTDPKNLFIIPTAALGKPDQERYAHDTPTTAVVWDTITAVDVHFWGDPQTGNAFIQANGFEPVVMQRATASDFKRGGL